MRTETVVFLIVFSLATSLCSDGAACTTCHSKNPKIVRMHQELGFRDCFKCHYPGSQRSPEEMKTEMTTDERCTNCHAKGAMGMETSPQLKH
jgi:Zn ribbon nucleic-acid-binding protein